MHSIRCQFRRKTPVWSIKIKELAVRLAGLERALQMPAPIKHALQTRARVKSKNAFTPIVKTFCKRADNYYWQKEFQEEYQYEI